MDQALLRFYYVRPELLRNSGLPGIERAAIALEIQCIRKGLTTLECDKPRDNHGHFYGDNGAQCPHSNGSALTNVVNKGISTFNEILRSFGRIRNDNTLTKELETAKGYKVVLEKGDEKQWGLIHFKYRRFISKDIKTEKDFDTLLSGVVKALMLSEPYESFRKNNYLFDFEHYRAVCRKGKDGKFTFLTGYKIDEEKQRGTHKKRKK